MLHVHCNITYSEQGVYDTAELGKKPILKFMDLMCQTHTMTPLLCGQ